MTWVEFPSSAQMQMEILRDTADGRVTQVIIGRDAYVTAITTGPFELGPVVGGHGWVTGMGAVGFTPPAPRIVLDWSSIVGFGAGRRRCGDRVERP